MCTYTCAYLHFHVCHVCVCTVVYDIVRASVYVQQRASECTYLCTTWSVHRCVCVRACTSMCWYVHVYLRPHACESVCTVAHAPKGVGGDDILGNQNVRNENVRGH